MREEYAKRICVKIQVFLWRGFQNTGTQDPEPIRVNCIISA